MNYDLVKAKYTELMALKRNLRSNEWVDFENIVESCKRYGCWNGNCIHVDTCKEMYDKVIKRTDNVKDKKKMGNYLRRGRSDDPSPLDIYHPELDYFIKGINKGVAV